LNDERTLPRELVDDAKVAFEDSINCDFVIEKVDGENTEFYARDNFVRYIFVLF